MAGSSSVAVRRIFGTTCWMFWNALLGFSVFQKNTANSSTVESSWMSIPPPATSTSRGGGSGYAASVHPAPRRSCHVSCSLMVVCLPSSLADRSSSTFTFAARLVQSVVPFVVLQVYPVDFATYTRGSRVLVLATMASVVDVTAITDGNTWEETVEAMDRVFSFPRELVNELKQNMQGFTLQDYRYTFTSTAECHEEWESSATRNPKRLLRLLYGKPGGHKQWKRPFSSSRRQPLPRSP